MNVIATEAKNRFGQLLEQAQHRPVFIEKSGQPEPPDAGKRFYAKYKDWVDQQNRLVEKYGVFGEEFRP